MGFRFGQFDPTQPLSPNQPQTGAAKKNSEEEYPNSNSFNFNCKMMIADNNPPNGNSKSKPINLKTEKELKNQINGPHLTSVM